MSRKSAAPTLVSSIISGSRERTTDAKGGAIHLEDDVRPGPSAAFVLVHARGVGLELLAVFGEQRQPDSIARDERKIRSASAWKASGTSTERARI